MKDYDVNVQRFHLVDSSDAAKTAAQDLREFLNYFFYLIDTIKLIKALK